MTKYILTYINTNCIFLFSISSTTIFIVTYSNMPPPPRSDPVFCSRHEFFTYCSFKSIQFVSVTSAYGDDGEEKSSFPSMTEKIIQHNQPM